MKILVELPTWIGDTTMATPAIENLSTHFNNADITLVGSSDAIEILRYHPKVNNFKVLDKKYISLLKTAVNLGRFDLFFSFRSSTRSKVFKFLVSSKKKYQYNKKKYLDCHLVEKYSRFLNDSLNQKFQPSKLIIRTNQHSISKRTNQILGINPGASYGDAKQWSAEEFAKVAISISNNYEIWIFGGAKDIKNAKVIEELLIKNGIKNFQNFAGKTSISDLVKKISQLNLFITGDSGPMHLAASFEIPTVSIFGPTKENETSQWMNSKSVIVKKNLNCQPCMKRTCPLGHNNCMKLIKSKDVLNAIDSFNSSR